MNWKLLGMFFLCLLVFGVGFFFGGVHWSWVDSVHSGEVAFWSMLGGWVSSLATLAAVAVSLFAASHAYRNTIEDLKISFKPLNKFTNSADCVNFEIINQRQVNTRISNALITIDGSDAININRMKAGGGPIPCTLHQPGDKWEFAFYLVNPVAMWRIFTVLESKKEPQFKRGFFLVETTMKTYKIKMPPVLLQAFHCEYKKYLERKNPPENA